MQAVVQMLVVQLPSSAAVWIAMTHSSVMSPLAFCAAAVHATSNTKRITQQGRISPSFASQRQCFLRLHVAAMERLTAASVAAKPSDCRSQWKSAPIWAGLQLPQPKAQETCCDLL
jgi:hypothetical protein